MSLYKRKGSPNYYAEITVRGNRVCRSTGTANRRAAEAFERQLREETRREIDRVGSIKKAASAVALDYTIDQMFGRYWIDHASKLRWAHEIANYAQRMVNISGDVRLAKFDQQEAFRLFEILKEHGIGDVALNRAVAVLRGAHTMAGKRWGCDTRPIDWRSLKNKEAKERIRWITQDEAIRLLSCLPPHIALIVEFALYTGLRRSEVLSLAWENLESHINCIGVEVKGGEWRKVELSQAARNIIDRAPRNGRYIFDATNLRKHLAAGLAAANIRNFRFHDLRHTHATWLRQNGTALEIVQRALGHSSIQVTQRYAHVDDREVRAAINSIDSLTPTNVVGIQPRAKSKFVYFITDGDAIKIGRSSDPQRRLGVLQTGHPKPLWLIGTISCDVMTEDEAHRRFSSCALRGEWFGASEETVSEIEALCRSSKIRHVGNFRSA